MDNVRYKKILQKVLLQFHKFNSPVECTYVTYECLSPQHSAICTQSGFAWYDTCCQQCRSDLMISTMVVLYYMQLTYVGVSLRHRRRREGMGILCHSISYIIYLKYNRKVSPSSCQCGYSNCNSRPSLWLSTRCDAIEPSHCTKSQIIRM